MSRSPYFFVEKYNDKTKQYELMHPYVWNHDRTKLVPADLYPHNADHDLFSIVERRHNLGMPEMHGIHTGIPENTCEKIKETYEKDVDIFHFKDEDKIYYPNAQWFTYADMFIYYMKNPKVLDYEAMDALPLEEENKEIYKPNPINNLKIRIDAFFEVLDDWSFKDEYSRIRIVCWIN